MEISKLIEDIECTKNFDNDFNITGISNDSRKVEKGNLFFCISGFELDGHEFAQAAIINGAVALVVTRKLDLDIPQVLVSDDRFSLALMSCKFYDYPAKKLKMIGVTGTNGKTTITYMIKSMLENCGKKVGIIGTIQNMIGDKPIDASHTTPESHHLNELILNMVNEKCEYIIIEVSSHALDLKRVEGIEFDVGIFTNLTQDHLDFHDNFINYTNAKSKLFKSSKICILNVDDKAYKDMEKVSKGVVLYYGINNKADFSAVNIDVKPDGISFIFNNNNVKIKNINMKLTGYFNVYNTLSAIASAYALGLDINKAVEGLEKIAAVDGRCQVLDSGDKGFSIILDYAHTPDSLKSTISSVRRFAKNRIITVFGCGGDRDKKKRAIMGEISGRLSDYSVITSDNPRTEKPLDIIEQIKDGMEQASGEYTIIENRRDAIEYALKMAQKDDIVILAGKGHETYQEINKVKYDFDEKVVVKKLLEKI